MASHEKQRYRASFEHGRLQVKPVVRADVQAYWSQYHATPTVEETPKGELPEMEAYRATFEQSNPGTPDYSYRPTPSSNPADPRTASWEYWRDQRVVKMHWGDGGTPYYYFNVTPAQFRSLRDISNRPHGSPGKFINRSLNSNPYCPVD